MESQIAAVAPQLTNLDKLVEAVGARLSTIASEWNEYVHENARGFNLNRELPECGAWRALVKSFDDLEDSITNEMHELEERINNMDKHPGV